MELSLVKGRMQRCMEGTHVERCMDCRKESFPTFLVNPSFTYELFWKKPSLRNRFRRFLTEFSLQERIVSYLYHSRTNLSFTYINTFSKKLIWDRIESGGNELFLTISCSDGNHMQESIQYKGTKWGIGTRWGYSNTHDM